MFKSITYARECVVITKIATSTQLWLRFSLARLDTYRKNKGLLTSSEIRRYREIFGKGQEQFSAFLGVGVASVKRWEGSTVQDSSNNELIKLKCDPEYAEANLVSNLLILDSGIDNGNRRFSPEKFALVLTMLLPFAESPLFFFKSIFYVDFLHFKRFNTSITGSVYEALDYGPVPAHYRAILDYLKIKGWIKNKMGHSFEVHNMIFDADKFSTDEIKTIEDVLLILKNRGKQFLFEKSHEEDAFKNTAAYTTISYALASSLSLN